MCLILFVYIGGGAGGQGERFARTVNGEALNGSGLLREEVWRKGNWESGCFTAAENYRLEARGWWSSWVYWWDIRNGRILRLL